MPHVTNVDNSSFLPQITLFCLLSYKDLAT